MPNRNRGSPNRKNLPELSPAKGMRFHISRDHVAREGVAGTVHAAGNSRVRPAHIGINFVMRRRQIKLSVSPERVAGKKHPLRAVMGDGTLRRFSLCRQHPRQSRHRNIHSSACFMRPPQEIVLHYSEESRGSGAVVGVASRRERSLVPRESGRHIVIRRPNLTIWLDERRPVRTRRPPHSVALSPPTSGILTVISSGRSAAPRRQQ